MNNRIAKNHQQNNHLYSKLTKNVFFMANILDLFVVLEKKSSQYLYKLSKKGEVKQF